MSFYSRLRQPVAFLPRWAFILIVCLVVLLPVCSLWGWVAWRDYSTVSMESGKHLLAAFEMGRTMRQGQSLQGLFYGTGEYPPLVYCTTAFILHFFPVNTESLALLSLVPYLLIISAAAYTYDDDSRFRIRVISLNFDQNGTSLKFPNSHTKHNIIISGFIQHNFRK